MSSRHNIEFTVSENIKFPIEPTGLMCKILFDKYPGDGKFGKWPVEINNLEKKETCYLGNARYSVEKAPHERFSEGGIEFTLYYGEKVLGIGRTVV